MCELFGLSSDRKITINRQLETFYSHSVNHRNGWGLVLLDEDPVRIEKEPVKAIDSEQLRNKLKNKIETSKCIAHIRKATIGEMSASNTHPFSGVDETGRRWILAHNGTIFESHILSPYQYLQQGGTDSERILLYLIDMINERERAKRDTSNVSVRCHILDRMIKSVVPGNKLDLLVYDGENLYIHKNEEGTLYQKRIPGGIMFATKPLDRDSWEKVPMNRLMVYRNGELVYTGSEHNCTYVHDEEKMKLLYLAYSGL